MAIATDTVAGTWVWTFSTALTTWHDMSCSVSLRLHQVTKRAASASTRCLVYSWTQASPWSLLWTAMFSWNVATFSWCIIPAWNFYIVCDAEWASRNEAYGNVSPAYPQAGTNVTFVSAWNWNTSQILARESLITDANTWSGNFLLVM